MKPLLETVDLNSYNTVPAAPLGGGTEHGGGGADQEGGGAERDEGGANDVDGSVTVESVTSVQSSVSDNVMKGCGPSLFPVSHVDMWTLSENCKKCLIVEQYFFHACVKPRYMYV